MQRKTWRRWKETPKCVRIDMWQEGNFFDRKEIPLTGRKFLWKKGNSSHGIKLQRKRIPFTGMKFLPQEESSFTEAHFCCRKKILVKGRKCLPQKGNSCLKKKIPAKRRKFLPKGEIPATRRKFLSQEGNFLYREEITEKKFLVYEGNSLNEFPVIEGNSWCRKKLYVAWKIF